MGSPTLNVTESDFQISAARHASAGELSLQVKNEGPDSHELIMVRKAGSLAMRADGMTVDEHALETSTVGALEPGGLGIVRHLSVHLTPGRYEIFCNMAGHYMAGMHSEIVVR
jgi:uncharacterized cupredoxin-like copper-binding protein